MCAAREWTRLVSVLLLAAGAWGCPEPRADQPVDQGAAELDADDLGLEHDQGTPEDGGHQERCVATDAAACLAAPGCGWDGTGCFAPGAHQPFDVASLAAGEWSGLARVEGALRPVRLTTSLEETRSVALGLVELQAPDGPSDWYGVRGEVVGKGEALRLRLEPLGLGALAGAPVEARAWFDGSRMQVEELTGGKGAVDGIWFQPSDGFKPLGGVKDRWEGELMLIPGVLGELDRSTRCRLFWTPDAPGDPVRFTCGEIDLLGADAPIRVVPESVVYDEATQEHRLVLEDSGGQRVQLVLVEHFGVLSGALRVEGEEGGALREFLAGHVVGLMRLYPDLME